MPFEFIEQPDVAGELRELKDIYRDSPTGTLSDGQHSIQVVKLAEGSYASIDPVEDGIKIFADLEGITIKHLERRPALPERSRPRGRFKI